LIFADFQWPQRCDLTMKVWAFCLASILAKVAGDQSLEKLLLAVSELKAEVAEQHHLIEELKEDRRLQTETSIDEKIAKLEKADQGLGGALDSAWLCLCGALVMFMHAGFAMLETGCCRAKNASNVLMKNLVNVCGGTMGWWIFGWAFAYGEQHGNGFIGTDGFFGTGFYTRDASTGVITPVECNSDGCQSTMLSWFFQCLIWSLSSSLVTLREETSWRVRAKHTTYLFHRIISVFHNRSQWEIGGFRQVFCYPIKVP